MSGLPSARLAALGSSDSTQRWLDLAASLCDGCCTSCPAVAHRLCCVTGVRIDSNCVTCVFARALPCCCLLRYRRQFKKPPIGPVGAHLSLTDSKWATASEVVLGYALEYWIVDNDDDNKVCSAVAE